MTTVEALLAGISFNKDGLVPAIAQEESSGRVLMLAWMDEAAVRETLETGRVCYYSRSRKALWRKGERSGQTQILKDIRLDCDGDALLLMVHQKGVACHTGRKSCFFKRREADRWQDFLPVETDPADLYG